MPRRHAAADYVADAAVSRCHARIVASHAVNAGQRAPCHAALAIAEFDAARANRCMLHDVYDTAQATRVAARHNAASGVLPRTVRYVSFHACSS